MSPETISLIIKWGPLVVVGVVFLWCFVVGLIRGTYKVLRRMIYVVLYVVLIWIFIEPITNLVLDFPININGVEGVRNYIAYMLESNEGINNFFSYSPDLKGLIIDSPEIILSPVLFLVLVLVVLPISYPIYWIYLIIYNLIAKLVFHRQKYERDSEGNILRNEKNKKIKVKRKKRRLLGGLLRGVQGVVLICLILLPVNMINRIYNKAKKAAELEGEETLCDTNDLLKDYRDICGYVDIYNETIFAKLGGEKGLDKVITDRLTTVEYNGKKLSLEEELSVVAVSVVLLNESGIFKLFENGELNLQTADFSVINFDKLDLLIDTLFSSTLISEVSDAGLRYVLNEVVKDDLVNLLKDDNIVSKLEYQNAEQIEKELKDVVGILKFAIEKNLADTAIDNLDNPISIVNNVNVEDVEALINKILSLRILNKAMPSVIEAYGKDHGLTSLEDMTTELNQEVASLFASAVKLVQTLEITNVEEITEGDLLSNVLNALFENGALKSNAKSELAGLLNDLNNSYLFKNVLSTQINKLLDGKDYKVDGRVLKYVDTKEAWLNELDVLDKIYVLYDEYKESETINYSNITGVLNEISGTKVILSVMPFAYKELLPKAGIEIDSEGMPVINFDKEDEDTSKKEFYDTWEAELLVLKNVADAVGVLELQSLEDINLDLLKEDENVDAMATIMSEIYSSEFLKDPLVDLMKDTMNEFVVDFEVEFTKDELLALNTKEDWKNELNNINKALEVDLSNEENINGENLDTIFTAIGDMKLFNTKKIDVLKYAIRESAFLTQAEYDSIAWPGENATQEEVDAFWDKETGVLVNVVDEKDTIKDLANVSIEEMDTDKIGDIINDVMTSDILSPIVVNKVSELLVDNDVRDDRDEVGSTTNLKNSIKNVSDWKSELATIKGMVTSIDDIIATKYLEISSYNNYDRVGEEGNYTYVASAEGKYIKVDENYYFIESAYRYTRSGEEGNYTYTQADDGAYLKVSETRVDEVFSSIEGSELLSNSRANLLLKAVRTINIVEVPSDVTVSRLKENNYKLYNQERDIIIEVSKSKNAFDNVSTMDLDSVNTDEIGGLLNTVSSSIIFGDYVADQISTVLVDNDVRDDRDEVGSTINLKNNIKNVSDWKVELATIKEMVTSIDSIITTTYHEIKLSDRYTRSGEEGNYTYTQADDGAYLKVVGDYYKIEEAYRYARSGELGNYTYTQADDGAYLKVSETRVDDVFASIEGSELLSNSRANLLLKAVRTINITEVPSDVTVSRLKENNYKLYNQERDIIVEISKNKNMFDNVAIMDLANIDTDEIGGLLDTVTSSIIFKGYVVEQIKTVFINSDVRDDRDYGKDVDNDGKEDTVELENSIASVSSWKEELAIIKNMLSMSGTTFNEAVNGKTRVEFVFDSIENSELLRNTRANLLIKAINTVSITGVSVPNNVTVATLKANNYEQYNNETNVFITFAENKDAVDNLSDITSLSGDNKKAMGAVLDAMKMSVIFKDKYNSTIDTSLSVIKNNQHLKNYGVTFSTDYANITWSSEYESDGVTIKKRGEIDNLLVISENIKDVASYNTASLIANREVVINTIGETLDAVSASSLLGGAQANVIADKVIQSLTGISSAKISDKKEPTETWAEAFDRVLSIY